MDAESATFWLDTIAAVMVALLVASAWFTSRVRRQFVEPLRGEAEVTAAPQAVLAAIGKGLTTAKGPEWLGCAVETANDREVRWKKSTFPRHEGRAAATGSARKSKVTWEVTAGTGFLSVAKVIVLVGGLVTGGLYYALWTFAVASEDPGHRAQVIQMVQAIHFLWPPFLFAGLASSLRRRIGDEVRRAALGATFR